MTKRKRARRKSGGGSSRPTASQAATPPANSGRPVAGLRGSARPAAGPSAGPSKAPQADEGHSAKDSSTQEAPARGSTGNAARATKGTAAQKTKGTAAQKTGSRALPDRKDLPPTSRLFGSLRTPSPLPKLRPTFALGFRAVVGAPALLLLPLILALLLWLGLVAAGIDHMPFGMTDVLAIPPVSSFFDVVSINDISGPTTSALGLLAGIVLVRSLVWAMLVGLTVESIESGRVSLAGAVRGLLAFPSVLVLVIIEEVLAFFASPLSRFVGLLALYVIVVGGLYYLSFAPIAAMRGRPRAAEALRLSARAARLPGSRHLGMVFLYFFVSFFIGFNPALQPGEFTLNPSFGVWVTVLVATVIHMVFLAGFAYRYIEVEPLIPAAPPPRALAPRGGSRPR